MSDVTRLLNSIESGNSESADDLLPLAYDELRQLAAARMSSERVGHTLQATALVHEAWIKLASPEGEALQWNNRRHFYAAAAEAMRRILIDHARRKMASRRGGRVMNNEQQDREDEIFHRALEQAPGGERTGYLAEAFGDYSDLRLSVEGLLEAHDAPVSLLGDTENDLESSNAGKADGEQAGDRYELIKEIGKGRMGTARPSASS